MTRRGDDSGPSGHTPPLGRARLPEGCLGNAEGLNLEPPGGDLARGNLSEAVMTHWHDRMVDRPETDGAIYVTGWTISGLAVLGTVVAVWVLGI